MSQEDNTPLVFDVRTNTEDSGGAPPAHLVERLSRKRPTKEKVPTTSSTAPPQIEVQQRKFLPPKTTTAKPTNTGAGTEENPLVNVTGGVDTTNATAIPNGTGELQLQPPPPLTPEQVTTWRSVIALFGDEVVSQLLSPKCWQHRATAVVSLQERLPTLPSGRHSPKVMEIYLTIILCHLAGDVVPNVFVPAFQGLFPEVVKSVYFQECSFDALTGVISSSLLDKLLKRMKTDTNVRVREAATSALMELCNWCKEDEKAKNVRPWVPLVLERLLSCGDGQTGGTVVEGATAAVSKTEFVRTVVGAHPKVIMMSNPLRAMCCRAAVDGLNSPNPKVRKAATSLVVSVYHAAASANVTGGGDAIFEEYFPQIQNPGTLRQLRLELEVEFCDVSTSPTLEADLRAQEEEDLKLLEEGFTMTPEQTEFSRRITSTLMIPNTSSASSSSCFFFSKQWKLRERFLKRLALRAPRLFSTAKNTPVLEMLCCVLDVCATGLNDSVPQVVTTAIGTSVSCITLCVSKQYIGGGTEQQQQSVVAPIIESFVSGLLPSLGAANTTVSVVARESITTLLSTPFITEEMILNGLLASSYGGGDSTSSATWRVQTARLTLISHLLLHACTSSTVGSTSNSKSKGSSASTSLLTSSPHLLPALCNLGKSAFNHSNDKVRACGVQLIADIYFTTQQQLGGAQHNTQSHLHTYLNDANPKLMEQVSQKINKRLRYEARNYNNSSGAGGAYGVVPPRTAPPVPLPPSNYHRLQTLQSDVLDSVLNGNGNGGDTTSSSRPSTIGAMPTTSGASLGGGGGGASMMSLKDRILLKKEEVEEEERRKKNQEQINTFIPDVAIQQPTLTTVSSFSGIGGGGGVVLRPGSSSRANSSHQHGKKSNLIFS